ncbi:hypothetical protein TNIN_403961 [Trichonephila inaurata madagascariensis]|uniref:Uncharacterized protein n=1 Tax=Trichonephila inaurata madagascariensis TaxID=2747483 RepID=A0A8X7CQN8_9ARAC|nr:hypothetical protein TNIN_403961 [Trichonephila inaurata madagascariensis]
MPSVKKTKKRKLRIISDNDEASRQKKSPSKPEHSSVTTVATNEEAVRESHGDALDILESSPFLPDPRDKRVSKTKEWSSDSFSGGKCIILVFVDK